MFPVVARELQRRRELAFAIPDPVLRRLALQSLECKRCNLEGAAAFELLAGKAADPALVRALTACQTICDYVDLVAEQPTSDPVANGYRLHEALIVALAPGELHRDYYAHHSRGHDGGYLRVLAEDVQGSIAELPSLSLIRAPLARIAERIAVYQSFNHGDAHGSYRPFERWARAQSARAGGLRWWETGAAAGSTLSLYALIASAASPSLERGVVAAIERAYFPWIGALHTLLDSLVDLDEDFAAGGRSLVGCYASPEQAAARMRAIARRALQRAEALPAGCRHALILMSMAGFYLCETRGSSSAHARAIAPALRKALGGFTTPATLIMGARRAVRGISMPGAAPSLDALAAPAK